VTGALTNDMTDPAQPTVWDEERRSYSKMYLEGKERQRNIKIFLENAEDIFGVERRDFEHVKTIQSCVRDHDSLVFSCLTDKGRAVRVRFEFYKEDTFRITMYRNDSDLDFIPIPGIRLPEKVDFRKSETEHAFFISTERLRFKVAKKPWSLEVSDASGKVLRKDLTIQEYAGGSFAGEHAPVTGFPQGPMGFITDEKEIISSYEFMWLFPDEHFYGLGEKFSALDKRGQRTVSWNNNPLSNENPRTYKNVPFFTSSRGYGTFINSSNLIIYQMGHPHHTSNSFEVKSQILDFFVFFGPSLKRILKSYTRVTGKPEIPPRWSFGLATGGWISTEGETEALAKRLRKLHIPSDMIHSGFVGERSHHCSFQWGSAFPRPRQMIKNLRKDGFRYFLYISPDVPEITEMYQEGRSKGYFIKRADGEVYLANLPYGTSAQVDFTNPGAVRWYRRKLKEQVKLGVSGFMADYGEAAPIDGVYHNGASGKEMHNLYPLLYTKTVYDAISGSDSGLIWARPGYGPAQRYPIQWDGDPGCNFPSMACVLRAGLGYGLSGVPFWSHEIGGFLGKPSLECYVRWAQLGAFTSHSRIFGWQTTRREPWEFGEEAVSIFKKYFRMKYRLIPYIYSYALDARETGLPIMRAMILEFQDDPNCHDKELQYMFGREFLVVPIFNEDGTASVYLPRGRWTDYWDKSVYEGPTTLSVKVPLSTLPLFVKEDSIIPMGPESERMDHDAILDRLTLDIYCRDRAEFHLRTDQGVVPFSCRRTDEKIVFSAKRSRGLYELIFNGIRRPSEVSLNHRKVTMRKSDREYGKTVSGWICTEGITKVKIRCDGDMTVTLQTPQD
jgi:alpha-D-xyloside xylohydrolase